MDIFYSHETAAQVKCVASRSIGGKTHLLKVKSSLCNQRVYQRLTDVLIPRRRCHVHSP